MNNALFFNITSAVEKILHLIIFGMVLFLCGYEINNVVSSLSLIHI